MIMLFATARRGRMARASCAIPSFGWQSVQLAFPGFVSNHAAVWPEDKQIGFPSRSSGTSTQISIAVTATNTIIVAIVTRNRRVFRAMSASIDSRTKGCRVHVPASQTEILNRPDVKNA